MADQWGRGTPRRTSPVVTGVYTRVQGKRGMGALLFDCVRSLYMVRVPTYLPTYPHIHLLPHPPTCGLQTPVTSDIGYCGPPSRLVEKFRIEGCEKVVWTDRPEPLE